MLNLMREWFHHLKFMLWVVVASFVITIFAVWGGAREAARGGVAAAWAARVDGEEIPSSVFLQRARNLDNFYRQLYGAGYAQQRRTLRLGETVIRDLIDNRLVAREAERLGLSATTDDLSRAITSDPSFKGPDGRFIGRQRYENLLRSSGLDVALFESEQLETLSVERLRSAVFSAFSVSDREVDEEVRRRNEKTRVALLRAPLAPLQPTGPAPASDLEAHLRAYPERFRRGESRRGLSLILPREKVAAGIKVPEEEIRRQYESELQTRYTRQEQRRASHILFKLEPGAPAEEVERVRRRAESVLRQASSGADFAELARQHSEDPGSAAQGGDLGFFQRGSMVPEFESETFRLGVGELSGLVQSSYGFHIIKVTGQQSAGTIPFEEARASIERSLAAQRLQEEMTRHARTWTERVRAGDSLEEIAREEKLEAQDTGILLPEERGGAATSAMVRALFALEPREASEPLPVPEGLAVVQLVEVRAARVPPLGEIQAEVEADWRRGQALVAGRQALERAGLHSAAPPAPEAAAKSLSGRAAEAGPFTRAEPPAEVPSSLRAAAFSTPVGGWSAPAVDGEDLVVLQVLERPPVDEATLAAAREGLRRSLLFQQRDRLYRGIIEALRSRAEIELNQPLIEQVNGA